MAKKGQTFKKYSAEFKLCVILDMREHGLSYKATMRKYFPDCPPKNYKFIKQWERIYLTEGAEGFTQSYVAAFAGYARFEIVFENCSIENYTIATNGATGYYSYVAGGDPASSVTLINCTQIKGNGEYAGIWHDGVEITDGLKWESTQAAE